MGNIEDCTGIEQFYTGLGKTLFRLIPPYPISRTEEGLQGIRELWRRENNVYSRMGIVSGVSGLALTCCGMVGLLYILVSQFK